MYASASLEPAPGQADLDILDEVCRKGLGELIDVLAVDLLWRVLALAGICRIYRAYCGVQGSVKNLGVKGKEVLRNLTGTRVL